MYVGLLYTSEVIFVSVCVFLVLLILIQKGRGGGLASAFGGAGGQTAFGSKTGDVLTWTTSVVFAIFLFLAVVLNLIANKIDRTSGGTANAAVASPLTSAEHSSLPAGIPQEPAAPVPNPGATPAAPAGNERMSSPTMGTTSATTATPTATPTPQLPTPQTKTPQTPAPMAAPSTLP